MITADELPGLAAATLKSAHDGKVGTVIDALASADGTHGTFVTVNTARMGTHECFVPIHEATLDGDTLVVPYAKSVIKDAPVMDVQIDLTPTDEQRRYARYGTTGDVLQS